MASAWSSAGLTIFALTVLARDSGAPSYSSPSTPVRARCFTLHSPHRATTGAPYPGLGMSHISRAPAALGAPPGEESFQWGRLRPPPGSEAIRTLCRLSRPIQTGPLSPNRNGDACVYPTVRTLPT